MSAATWYLRTPDETFGPETRERLVEWARRGSIQPGQEVSDGGEIWLRVEEVPFLDMRFSIDIGDGNPRGPFNREAAAALLSSGRLPAGSKLVEVRGPFDEAPAEAVCAETEDAVEDTVADEATASEVTAADEAAAETSADDMVAAAAGGTAAPPENVVIREVPVERIVEKVVVKEVPVERVVEKVVTVVDETRVKELEGLLEEERRHTNDLQTRLDAASKAAAAERVRASSLETALAAANGEKASVERQWAADKASAAEREQRFDARVKELEEELRRLPQTASEVAEIQVAMHEMMTTEAGELAAAIEAEKREADEFHRRCTERAERLLERRRLLLKRAGTDLDDMTRKALVERPEDPRTAQLRKELEQTRRLDEKRLLDAASQIRDLTTRLAEQSAAEKRATEKLRDLADLVAENERLRARLQTREAELLSEREKGETFRQNQAASQQALMARLSALESTSIGTSQTLSTNQSREAGAVRLPSWMRFGSGR